MSRCTLALLLTGTILAAHPAGAQEAAPAETKPSVAAAEEAKPAPKPVGTYELKNKSFFNVTSDTRAPFLPIGWVKPSGPVTVAVVAKIDESSFRLTSVLLGNPSLAVINGRSYEEGQFLRMPRTSGAQPIVRVYRIGDGQVWLQHEGRVFTVPLKRPELNERRSDGPVLNEDRDVVPQAPSGAPAPAPAHSANPMSVPVPR